MKKAFALVLALAMALTLVACGGTPASSSAPASGSASASAASAGTAEGDAEYAVILKVLSSQYWQTMRDGIEAKAEELGIKVDIYAANTEDDVEGQVSLLENAISKGYKAIGVAPISDVNLNNAIADATEQGIKIVNIDEAINMEALTELGGAVYAYVATDNVKVGQMGAEYLIEQIGGDGATETFEAAGLTVVDSQPADWDRTKAYDLATNYITAHPDLKAIYCCNDTMAMGVQEAVEASGKDIKVCGTDGNADAIQSVADGNLCATVAQDAALVGATGLELMVEAVETDAAMEPTVDIPVTRIDPILITIDNAAENLA